ncbi:MAG: toxin-antitoxin system YwqK family antitoxin [Flavobacteriaceae bacterium]
MKLNILFVFLLSIGLYAQENTPEKQLKKKGSNLEYVEYHSNGQIAQKGTIKANKLDGIWVSYSKAGEKLSQGHYTNGKKTGKWFFWNENGLIEADFNNNKLITAVSWDNRQTLAKN